jgi:N-acetylglucosamine-6-phosphate deacetylase
VDIEDAKIFDVVRSPRFVELPSECREVPGFVCPGFIDLQINGAFGVDVGPDTKALKTLGRELPKTGVTSFLPTAVSWPPERYADFLGAIREATSSSGAVMLGAHIEGPFLSLARKGAHDPANLRPVDLDLAERLVGSGMVRVMTLAPELPRAKEAIRLLREVGVVASAGRQRVDHGSGRAQRRDDYGQPAGRSRADGLRDPSRDTWCVRKGKNKAGADADLVVLSTEGMVEETIVAGEIVYQGRGESHVR